MMEATETLAIIQPKLEQLALAFIEIQDPDRRMRISQLTEANSSSEAMAPLLEPAETAAALVQEIEDAGVVVRDPSIGLIDFPSERDGEPIFLCWRLGDEGLSFWHGRDDGFAGRQPL